MSTNGKNPRDPLDSVDDAIATLENTDWTDEEPITGQHLIEAMKAGAVIATGRHDAIKADDRETPTDPKRPITDPPKSGLPGLLGAAAGGVARILGAVNSGWTFGGLALLVGAFVAWLLWGRR